MSDSLASLAALLASEMLRNMLVDRFKLVTHTEMREMPVYVLGLARTDGRLGPSLKPTSEDCLTTQRGNPTVIGGGLPPAPAVPGPGGVRGGGPWADPRRRRRTRIGRRCLPLQEQLGLKLEPQRAPIQVVIDSAAMPTEN